MPFSIFSSPSDRHGGRRINGILKKSKIYLPQFLSDGARIYAYFEMPNAFRSTRHLAFEVSRSSNFYQKLFLIDLYTMRNHAMSPSLHSELI